MSPSHRPRAAVTRSVVVAVARGLAVAGLVAAGGCSADAPPREVDRIDGPAQVDEDRLTTGGAEQTDSGG